jgi:hypothetical protein
MASAYFMLAALRSSGSCSGDSAKHFLGGFPRVFRALSLELLEDPV